MFTDYGFVLPSGAPPTEESLQREKREREEMLEQAAKAKREREEAARAPPKLKQLSAKQAASFTKVAKLNAAQVAKLDAAESEAYRAARAEEKKAIKLARRELNTPEERAAAKAEARRQRKEQAKEVQVKKLKDAAAKEAAVAAAEAAPVKAPKPPKPAPAPLPPSQSAATNPSLRGEGLKKKDESLRQQERAERKKARRIAMGLPAEEEEMPADSTHAPVEPSSSPMEVEETAEQTSHKRKLDDMRNSRMAAVMERDEKNPLNRAMRDTSSSAPEITVRTTSIPTAAAPPSASEVTDALKQRPQWMVRGKNIATGTRLAVDRFRLDPRLLAVLKKQGITSFFATQSELLPIILKSYGTNDICCCAPTGSGKTLTYLLPILHSLSSRIVLRLRALILVPSRDLALQVHRVVQPFAAAVGVKVECVLGQMGFSQEKRKLGSTSPSGEWQSEVDILICTPGRLIDHLAAAQEEEGYGFHLRDLQYFVVDEVDRLLTQTYQDWPGKILNHIYDQSEETVKKEGGRMEVKEEGEEGERVVLHAHHLRRRAIRGGGVGRGDELSKFLPLQKLLFSATLTNNPQKLQQLHLANPLFFTESTSERKKFQLPVNLKQWIVNLKEEMQKPMALIVLLREIRKQHAAGCTASKSMLLEYNEDEPSPSPPSSKKPPQILIFTSSIESTHRLYRLLELFEDGKEFRGVAEFSSALQQKERNRILRRFGRGECEMSVGENRSE
jgi:ATP-dependent RNA helicase DDX51/DBP6